MLYPARGNEKELGFYRIRFNKGNCLMAKEKKKGDAFVITSKGIYSHDVFLKVQSESKRNASKQLKETQKWMAENGLINPPYPPTAFLVLSESNPVYARCVRQIAIDVAGLGWTLQLREDKADNKPELERINTFLDHPNPDKAFRNILTELLIDYGIIGCFSMEVIRDKTGEGIAEVYHVPAHTIKVHQSKDKYCQVRDAKKVWFKKFGYEQDIDSKTGKEGSFEGEGSGDKANELIYHKNYYPLSDYYGAPDVLPAIGDVIGAISQRDYNLAFFQNYGIPSAIVTLEGEWSEGAETKIKHFIENEIKGTTNAHKTLVMTLPEGEKVAFNYEPLTGDQPKEAGFRLYEQERRNNIMMAYSMPPERIGVRITGKLGGNVAEEAMKVYVQSVVEPLQQDMEEIINNKLLQSEIYKFKFNDIDLRNYSAEVDQHVKLVGSAIETPNEARIELLAKEEYPEGDRFYVASNLVEVGEPEEREEE